MKEKIFISYSNYDKTKVDLIERELLNNKYFQPIIIASDREALKPLAKKVSDGIDKSNIILPILTKNSYLTQWINQEIGFAKALDRKIVPIVDKEIIKDLKGFIHKEIDLPYHFTSTDNKSKENRDFIKCFRVLLADLEKELQSKKITDNSPKTNFERNLEKADKLNAELAFKEKRTVFLNSQESVSVAKSEILKIIANVEEKIKILEEKNFIFGIEKNPNTPVIIIKSEGFCFSIAWEPNRIDKADGSTLFVRFWEGYISIKIINYSRDEERPRMVQDSRYSLDIDKENNYCWLNNVDKSLLYSDSIVDRCLNWLVDRVVKKKLEQK
jgi:hypothetical protein